MRKRPLLLTASVFLIGTGYALWNDKRLVFVFISLLVYVLVPLFQHMRFGQITVRGIVLFTIFFLGMFHMQKEMEFREQYMSKITNGQEVT
ncbi:MAG: hypothetical protein IKJ01_02395, partial [Lachnospiraceae bacterium]|nr:hypothetical protein [Lachnospiraceae bacterium]